MTCPAVRLWRRTIIGAEAIGEYQSSRQPAKERELGILNYQRVDIRINNSAG